MVYSINYMLYIYIHIRTCFYRPWHVVCFPCVPLFFGPANPNWWTHFLRSTWIILDHSESDLTSTGQLNMLFLLKNWNSEVPNWRFLKSGVPPNYPSHEVMNDHGLLVGADWNHGLLWLSIYIGNFIIPTDEVHDFSRWLKPPNSHGLVPIGSMVLLYMVTWIP